MIVLKVTEEYRVDTEQEVKDATERFRVEAREKGYILNSVSYTKKEKKSKGEVIDECYLMKVQKVYGGIWDGLDS